jgi:hypothetical protein
MAVPERQMVDDALAHARKTLEQLPASSAFRALAGVGVDLTEALVRQIRDADDTQATVIAPAITEQLTDLTTVVGENLSKMNDTLERAAEKHGKGGLFGG